MYVLMFFDRMMYVCVYVFFLFIRNAMRNANYSKNMKNYKCTYRIKYDLY
jgi:hypothetical protein